MSRTAGEALRVLLLSRYGRKAASSRVRSYQYLPRLREAGIEVTAAPLLPDRYLEGFYEGGAGSKPWKRAVGGYLRRARALLGAGRYDLLWIEKELFPWGPAWGERLLARLGLPYAVDYDDARFHRYDRHPSPAVRRLFGRKLDRVMERASAVVAGSRYLAEQARARGARRVRRIPSAVDLDDYPESSAVIRVDRREGEGAGPFRIGWIGTPFSARYLELVREPLAEVRAELDAELTAVGAGSGLPRSVEAELRPWTEETEVDELLRFDAGIMPLPDEPFERGKCAYKAVQYMAAGLPVVASPVGAAPDVIEHGETGFLASTAEEWARALRALHGDPGLRERMGRAGRRRVEGRYSVQALWPELADALREAARGREGG